MKKLSLVTLIITTAYQLCLAQIITVSGTVKNEQGNPVHYAFVKDGKAATYTDTLGGFSLTADPATKITVTCKGYNDASIDAAGNTNLQVVLKGAGAAAPVPTGDAKLLVLAFTNNNTKQPGSTIGFGGIPIFTNAQQIIGHRFLFTEWVHGYMVKANGDVVQNPSYLFNYDKIKGDLFITEDLNTVTLGDKNVIKAFTLYEHDQPFTFEKMTGISNDLYSQVISAGSMYKIYKLTATKFVAANYTTNGISSSGNAYDEFADNNSYYMLNVKTGNFQQLTLKKKALKTAFADDAAKLNTFMAAHADDNINDDYLKNLGDALNQ